MSELVSHISRHTNIMVKLLGTPYLSVQAKNSVKAYRTPVSVPVSVSMHS